MSKSMPFQLLFTKTTKKLLPNLFQFISEKSSSTQTCWVFKTQKDLDDFKILFPSSCYFGKHFFTHQSLKTYFLEFTSSKFSLGPSWIQKIIYQALLGPILKKLAPQELKNKHNWIFYIQLLRKEGKSLKEIEFIFSVLGKHYLKIAQEFYQSIQLFYEEHPFLLDSHAQESFFTQISQSPFPPNTEFAFIGWPYLDQSLKQTLQKLSQLHPHPEHWVLLQNSEENLEDNLIKQWPDLDERTLQNTKYIKAQQLSCNYQIRENASPYYNFHHIQESIQKDLQNGILKEEIFILESNKLFLNHLFLNICFHNKHQLQTSQSFYHFPLIQKSTSLTLTEALDFIEKESKKIDWKNKELNEMSQYFYALSEWKKVLSSLLFLEKKLPTLSKNKTSISLEEISKEIKTPRLLQNNIQFGSIENLGLGIYKKIYIIDSSSTNFEKTCPAILGKAIPLPSYSLFYQKKYFEHLLGSAYDYYFYYSSIDEKGRPKVISPWVEEISNQAKIKINSKTFISLPKQSVIKNAQNIELHRFQNFNADLLIYQGKIKKQNILEEMKKKYHSGISPSLLNDYEECPYRFLAKSFYSIKEEKESSLDFVNTELGILSHNYLELFFKENKSNINSAASNKQQQDELIEQLNIFHEQFTQKTLEKFPHIPTLNQEKALNKILKGLQFYLNYFWKQQNEFDNFYEPFAFEVQFHFNLGEYLNLNTPFYISGRIDRIDVNVQKNEFIVIDYKTGNTEQTTSKLSEIKSFALPLYLLGAGHYLQTQHQLEVEAKGALLYSLADAKFYPGIVKKEIAHLFDLKRHKKGIYEEEEWKSYWEELQLKLNNHCQHILEGDFLAHPNECKKSCPAQSVCRYPYRETT